MISHEPELRLLLKDIRSTHNVGSIFRTADAMSVSKIYISGYTPAPVDRFGRERADIAKASLGAEKMVAWESIEDAKVLIKSVKKEGFTVCALEQDEKSISLKDFKTPGKILLIPGNEVGGVEKEILALCDFIFEIPMHGAKESLNVSVATGIALDRLRN